MATSTFTLDMPTAVRLVSYCFSTFTILSCLFLKVPQIMYIKEKRSADGIYIQAMAMEIIGFTIMTLYNYSSSYSVMTYLEYPIILLQVYVMLYYVLMYKGMLDMTIVPLLTATYFAAIAGVVLEILPRAVISFLVPLCTPLSGFAKVTYIYGIVKTGNAENVSLTTWIISILSNLARVFTVYVDSSDTKLMANFLISTALSSGVLGTALYYQNYYSDRLEAGYIQFDADEVQTEAVLEVQQPLTKRLEPKRRRGKKEEARRKLPVMSRRERVQLQAMAAAAASDSKKRRKRNKKNKGAKDANEEQE